MERPAPPDGEHVLVAKLARGDHHAFDAMVREHQDRIYDFCFRMLLDREEASDLMQETFLSVFQNIANFRRDAKLSTWMYRIAKNLCLNRLKYLQRRGRGRNTELASIESVNDALLSSETPSPHDMMEAHHERLLLQKAIASLEDEQRLLVVLRDIEGLSYEEMVHITELPEGTVKSRLHRARERLATRIAELEE